MLRFRVRALLLAGLLVCAGAARPTAAADADARRVGPITVQGNTRTVTELILRELGFREGDPWDAGAVDRAWDHLEDLGDFAFVDISEGEETDDGRVPLTITVEEDKTFHYYPLIDYDRRHKYRLGARVEEDNLRGRGERAALEATWVRVHGYRATWDRPWLANRRWLEGGLTAGWEQAQFVWRPTKYSRWDAGLRVRARLRGPGYLEADGTLLGFRQHSDVRETAPDRGDGSPGDLLWTHGWRNRFTAGLTLGYDSRDLAFYPLRGAWHRLRVARAMSDGFDSYSEASGDLRQFVPLPWHKVLALHAYGRRVSHAIPLEDRLYWAGPETIRGYRYASIEGEEGWLLSGELRWPLFLMPISPQGHVIGVGLHLFCDAGDAWYDGAHPGAPLLSWGGGAHVNLSSLNLRFELARTREGENVFQFEDRFNF